MADEKIWYFVTDSQTKGPVGYAALLTGITQQEIDRDTLVWKPGFAEWTPAGSVEGLFLPPFQPQALALKKETLTPPLPPAPAPSRKLEARRLLKWLTFLSWAVVFSCLALATASLGYTTLIFDAIRAIKQFGFGQIPRERFALFLLVSEHWDMAFLAMLLFFAICWLMLLWKTANALKALGVSQHFKPSWTVMSLSIPLWNLYRPWAGLAEVRRTVKNYSVTGSAPSHELRGFDRATFGLGFTVVVFNIVMSVVFNEQNMLGKRPNDGASETIALFNDMAASFLVSVTCYFVLAMAVFAYWFTFRKMYEKILIGWGNAPSNS
jgi:hypothetical protein